MHPNIGKAMAGGLVGTMVMTAMMYYVSPMMMGMKMDIAAMLGSMLGGSWAAGMMMHFINGSVIFPAIYVYLLYERLPGAPVVRGTIWGTILWFLDAVAPAASLSERVPHDHRHAGVPGVRRQGVLQA